MLGQLPPTQVGPGGDILGPELNAGSRGGSGCIPSPTARRGTQPQAGRLRGGRAQWGAPHLHPLLLPCPGIFSSVRPQEWGQERRAPGAGAALEPGRPPNPPATKSPPGPRRHLRGPHMAGSGGPGGRVPLLDVPRIFSVLEKRLRHAPPPPPQTQEGWRPHRGVCAPAHHVPPSQIHPAAPSFEMLAPPGVANPPFSLRLPHGHVHGESRKSIFIDEGILSKSHPNPHTSTPELRGKSWIPFMCNRRCLKYQNSERSLSKCKG